MVKPNYDNIPAELKALPNWVGFRVWWDDKEKKHKKMPVDIQATVAAKKADPAAWKDIPAESDNPKTWCDFETAANWLKAKKPHKKYNWHIGFAFEGSGIIGIDLDKCVGEDGSISEFAKGILNEVQSYTEYSPSGTGLHILSLCSKSFPGGGLHRKEIEVYQIGRFFTVTGNRLPDSPVDLIDCTDSVLNIYDRFTNNFEGTVRAVFGDSGVSENNTNPNDTAERGKPRGLSDNVSDLLPLTPKEITDIAKLKFEKHPDNAMSDDEIIRRACESRRKGDRFTLLLGGDWRAGGYPSQSEADMSFCMSLAFWTGKDFRQIDSIFRRSGLHREKWDKIHYAGGVTYGERTVAEAIAKCSSVFKEKRCNKTNAGGSGGDNKDGLPNIVSGVFVQNNAYCMDKGKDTKRLTNFVLEPIESVTIDGESRMTARLVNSRGETAVKRLKFSDFNSVSALRGAIGGSDLLFIVICSDTELQYVKDYVSQLPCPEKKGFKGIGIDFIDDGSGVVKPVFICAEGAFRAGFNPAEGIVQIPDSIKITSDIHRVGPIARDDLSELGSTLIGFNELPKAAAVLCWSAACFIKPHLMRHEIRFPHLILTGEAGSGKSSTYTKVIRPLFSADKPLGAADITPFTFITDAGSSNILPLVIDEYKPWAMSKAATDMIHSGMRNLYDGQGAERGRADLSVRKYYLTSPLILIGESSPSEAAIKERSIELLFSKADLIEKKDFIGKLEVRKTDIRSFGKSLLLAALEETPGNVRQNFNDCLSCVPKEFESRVRSNIAVLLMGLYLITKVCRNAGTEFKRVFGLVPAEIKTAMIAAVRDYTLENGKSKSIIEHTLEIMDRMCPEVIRNEHHIKLTADGKRVGFNFKRIYDPFTQYIRVNNIDAERLTYAAFTAQFRKKSYFTDYSNARMDDGTGNRQMAQCFFADAELLREACDINNILTTVGYVPPKPKQENMFNGVPGDRSAVLKGTG